MGLKPTYRDATKIDRKLLTSETNAVYAGMIETVDDSVGRVVAKLKEINQFDNTLFIFYSDNGSTTDCVPCVPLNGGKNSTYEAGVRVPAFMVWKGRIKAATEYNGSIYIGDVFNTVMEATGQAIPATHKSDSTSLLPVFRGEQLPPREFIWYFPLNRPHWGQRANAAIFDEKSGMKYVMFFTGDEDELYDIKSDIGETTNLAEQRLEVAESLKERLVAFLKPRYEAMGRPPKCFGDRARKKLGLEIPVGKSAAKIGKEN